jgi:SNF2 family DNA or RNA helicase
MFRIKSSIDKGWLIIEYDNELSLEELKGCLDGCKIRNKKQVLFPEEAIINVPGILDKSNEIIFEEQTESIFKKVYSTSLTRMDNVRKIKESYFKENIPFNYKYTGTYPSILKHQKVFYNMMFYTNKCGILGDAGTCKTAPFLWVINQRLKMGTIKKALIITLSDLKETIMEEIKLQCPEMYKQTIIINGSQHANTIVNKLYKKKELNREYDVYINNYESMNSFFKIYNGKMEFDMVVCDEAHRISHVDTKQTQTIIAAFGNTKYKYAVTGTLNSNFLLSFFGVWRFLGPDTVPYSSFREFRRHYMRSVDPDGRVWIPLSKNHIESVAKIIGDISVKYTKEECLDLPGVVYHKIYYDMTSEQETYYKQASKDMIVEFNNICLLCNKKDICDRSENEKCSNTVQLKNALVMTGKLAQIAMGFYNNKRIIIDDDEKEVDDSNTIFFSDNQRIKALKECLEQIGENKVIIWCYSVIFMKNIV